MYICILINVDKMINIKTAFILACKCHLRLDQSVLKQTHDQLHSSLVHLSRTMRKLEFCLCENKGADQLCCNCEADQRLCFRYTDSTIPLLLKYKISSIYPSSEATQTGLSDLVGNHEDRFSRNAAHFF